MAGVRRVGDRYEIIREVGRGGMGVVYLVRDVRLDREVALKELRGFGSESGFGVRFLGEFERAAALRHPSIVSVHECIAAGDTAFVVSEYFERGSLRAWVGRLTVAQVVGVLEDVLEALAHAHRQGVAHLDLKPENVLVTGDGGVKVADFGVAFACQAARTAGSAPTDEAVGTPTYMAPEQALARGVGPWSDLYALGVMAYELLLGRPPFADAESRMSILLSHVNERPPPPRSLDPDLDPGLAAWLERLLEKDPAARPSTALGAWDELEGIVIPLLGPRWRGEARLPPSAPAAATLPERAARSTGTSEIPQRAKPNGLRVMLREAARAGVIPAGIDPAPAAAAAAASPAAAAAPPFEHEEGFVEWPVTAEAEAEAAPPFEDEEGFVEWPVTAEPEPAPEPEPQAPPSPVFESSASPRRRRSLWPRVVVPVLAVGALAAASKWLFGLSLELGDVARDLVQCTVFAPPSAAPGDSLLVQVFVHLPEEANEARAIATELDTDARRRAFRSLEAPIRAGSRLDFELQLYGLEIDDPVASLVWHRRTEAVQFGVTVPTATPVGTVVGTVSIGVDSVPVGHVKFKLAIEPDAAARPSEPQGEDARRYRFAFISYSSTDRAEVLRRVQLLSSVGIRYFQDLLSLEPGDRWLNRIELGIDQCDLFLLFWSSDAKGSEWVRQEVQYALARKAGDDLTPPEIRPVIIEGPPIVEPWEELAHLHFNDRLLYLLRP